MTHFKISRKELELFVTSMKVYETKIDEEHPHSDTYPLSHEISKEKRYINNTIGKMENELKIRSMRTHKVTT